MLRFIGKIGLVTILALAIGCRAPTDPTNSDRTTAIRLEDPDTLSGLAAVISGRSPTGLNDGITMVSGSYCGATAGDPYKCCVNSPGVYGNCTVGAWEQAKAYWKVLLPAWGDAGNWASYAQNNGFYVDTSPTKWSIGVSPTHVAFVLQAGSTVTVYDQQCGFGFKGGYQTRPLSKSVFSRGFIRAPIPEVVVLIWSGANQIGNGGTLTVTRSGGKVTVSFGFSLLRSNVTNGPSTFRWKIAGTTVSTSGQFNYTFAIAGSYPVQVTVTNTKGVQTKQTATVVVR